MRVLSARQTTAWRACALAALVAGLVYLAWRWHQPLPAAVWFAAPLLLAETASWAALAITFAVLWRQHDPVPGAAPATISDCLGRDETTEDRPIVLDVFVSPPVETALAGEPAAAMARRTIASLGEIAYPHPIDLRVHLLDPRADPALRRLALEDGLHLIAGPAPATARGSDTSDGLRQLALDSTTGDFMLVMPAGSLALPHLLTRGLGHFRDPEVALVQTPVCYHDLPAGDPLACDPMVLSDLAQRRRNAGGAAISWGAGAFLRREAIMFVALRRYGEAVARGERRSRGLLARLLHRHDPQRREQARWQAAVVSDIDPIGDGPARDLALSLAIQAEKAARWRTLYDPQVCLTMPAPRSGRTLAARRHAMAEGMLDLALNGHAVGRAGLSPAQRLHYAALLGAPLMAPIWLVLLIAPAFTLLTGIATMPRHDTAFFAHVLPAIALTALALDLATRDSARPEGRRRHALGALGRVPTNAGLALEAIVLPARARREAFQVPASWPQATILAACVAGIVVGAGRLASGAGMGWFAFNAAGSGLAALAMAAHLRMLSRKASAAPGPLSSDGSA